MNSPIRDLQSTVDKVAESARAAKDASAEAVRRATEEAEANRLGEVSTGDGSGAR